MLKVWESCFIDLLNQGGNDNELELPKYVEEKWM